MSTETVPRQPGAAVAEHPGANRFIDQLAHGTGHSIAQALETWRAAERELEAAEERSPAWYEAQDRSISARSEYHRLFRLADDAAASLHGP